MAVSGFPNILGFARGEVSAMFLSTTDWSETVLDDDGLLSKDHRAFGF